RGQGAAVRIEPKARAGIFLVAAGFFVTNVHSPRVWSQPLEPWRAASGLVFGLAAIALAWAAVGNLGRQWRIDAGLNADHELIQTGAYRIVRHPIYLSILLILLMTIAFAGTLPGWPIGIALAIMGTEIRVRVEDRLLLDRFGDPFAEWRKRVPAYLPFIR
ncbi:MAG: isoprenylcysteine carboxylmethyltransferase family protein, partial [Acidobacteriota bacterium]